MKQSVRVVTATATLNGSEDVIVFNSTSNINFSVGPAYGDGRQFTLKNVNTGKVTLVPSDEDTFDGQASVVLDKDDCLTIVDYVAESWAVGSRSKDDTPFYSSTDPATSAAVTKAIVDVYGGVLITTTSAGNAQTIASPSITTEIKKFTVINNDTSTNSIAVNGITIPVGKSQTWIWDGSAWIEIDLGITSLPVPYNQGGTGVAVTGVNHIFYVDGSRTDTYTADGSMSRPYKTILAAQNAVNLLSAALLDSAAHFELCKFIINIAPGKYTDNVAISTARYIRWNMEGVEVSGDVTITQNQLGLADYYGKIEFFGGLGNRAYRGNCGLFSGTITFLKDAYDSLAYDAFIGCSIAGNLQYGTSDANTHGTWVLCLINSYFPTSSKFISAYLTDASENVLIESYGYNKIVSHIAKQDGSATKIGLFDCNETYFDLINITPVENCKVKNCTFNSTTSIVAAKTLSVDANSYKSLMAQTPTLTDMTISYLDNTGPNVTPAARTNNPTVGTNTINGNITALDAAIGTDAQLTAVARTSGPVAVANSVQQNIDALDSAIGFDAQMSGTPNVCDKTANVFQNLDKLDTYKSVQTVKKTIGGVGVAGCDFNFATAENTDEQVIDLGAIIPAFAKIYHAFTHTNNVFTGATTLVAETGTSSSGNQLIASATIYAADAITEPASSALCPVAISASAGHVYVSATPGANWSLVTAGKISVYVTFINVTNI